MELKLRKFRYFLLDPKITYPILMKLLKRELTQAEKVRLWEYRKMKIINSIYVFIWYFLLYLFLTPLLLIIYIIYKKWTSQ